jgi:hypothetical protein
MKVAHPSIPVKELRKLSSEDAEVIHLGEEMEINIREALKIGVEILLISHITQYIVICNLLT